MGSKVFGFAVPALLSAVSPLLVLPALTSQFGAEAWAQIAVCQSVGLAFAVVVELGWGLNGPQRVARAGAWYRSKLYLQSFWTKGIVFVPALVFSLAVSLILATGSTVVTATVTTAAVLTAFSPVWFFIGLGSPRNAIFLDAVPRVLVSIGCAVAISFGAPLWAYGASMLLAALVPPFFGLSVVEIDWRLVRLSLRRLFYVIRTQVFALGGRVASATYIALPVALVSAVAPGAVPVFAASDRLLRMGLVVLQSVPSMLQSWLGAESTIGGRYNKSARAVRLNVFVGAFSGIAFTFLAPTASEFVFSGTATVPYWLAGLGGAVMMLTVVSRATGGVALVGMGDIRSIAISALVGCLVGVPVICMLAWQFGAAGAVIGQIVAESSVLAIQCRALRLGYRRQMIRAWRSRAKLEAVLEHRMQT